MTTKHFGKTLLQAITIVTGVYLVLAIILTFAQRKLMYFPTNLSMANAQMLAIKHGFTPWENDRFEIIGWKRVCKSVPPRGQVLIFHGNAGWALNWMHYADGLQNVEPLDIYILEYPGYGIRAGSPSQKTIFAAADEGMALLERNGTVYLIGESLGTGVAAYLAGTRAQSTAGVFLVAPYNNMTAAAKKHLPIFPVSWMLWDKYPSDRYLNSYHGPLGVLLAGKDTVIPSELGRKLFDDYRAPKRLWFYPNAGHNDVHRANPEIWKEVIAFWHNPIRPTVPLL